MPRQKQDITRHNVNLRSGDYQYLVDYCQDKDIDASGIIRQQIAKTVDTLRAIEARVKTTADELDVKL